MRTIRDLAENGFISAEKMKELVDAYNATVYTSTNVSPNEMTKEQEREYVMKKRIGTQDKTRAYDFKSGDRVRIIIEPKAITKKRSN